MAREKKFEFQSGFEPPSGQVFPVPPTFEDPLEHGFRAGLYRIVFYFVTGKTPQGNEDRENFDVLRFPTVEAYDDEPDADPLGIVQLCAARCYHHQAQYTDRLTYRLRLYHKQKAGKATDEYVSLNAETGVLPEGPDNERNPFHDIELFGSNGVQDTFIRTHAAMSAEQRLHTQELRVDLAAAREMNVELLTRYQQLIESALQRADTSERMFERGLNMFVDGLTVRTEALIQAAVANNQAAVERAKIHSLEAKQQREFRKDLLQKMAPVGLFAAGDMADKKGKRGLAKILQKMASNAVDDPDGVPDQIKQMLGLKAAESDEEEVATVTPINGTPQYVADAIDVYAITTEEERTKAPLLTLSRLLSESLSEAQQTAIYKVVGPENWEHFIAASEATTEETVSEAMMLFVVESFLGEGDGDAKIRQLKSILVPGQREVLDELTLRMMKDGKGPVDADKYCRLFGGTPPHAPVITMVTPTQPTQDTAAPAAPEAPPSAEEPAPEVDDGQPKPGTVAYELARVQAELERVQTENENLRKKVKPKRPAAKKTTKKGGAKKAGGRPRRNSATRSRA